MKDFFARGIELVICLTINLISVGLFEKYAGMPRVEAYLFVIMGDIIWFKALMERRLREPKQ